MVLSAFLDDEEVQSYLTRLDLVGRAYPKMPTPKKLRELVQKMLAA